jgi:T5SS/PEP-CTERM-associated repeat protein
MTNQIGLRTSVLVWAILLYCATNGAAVTRTWIASDGNWNEPTNWTPAGVPGNGDVASIELHDGAARTVIYDYSGPAVTLNLLALDLNGGIAGATTLSMSDHNLRATNEYVGYFGRGTVEQSGGTNSVDSTMYIGFNALSLGTYSLSGGALSIAGDQYVGYNGSGALNITGGSTATNSNGDLGLNGGSSGSAVVDGAGSQWINNSVLAVGLFGSGSLSVTAGGKVTSVNGRIGRETGATGTVLVDGPNSMWQMTGDLTVGSISGTGTGTLTIQNQALVHAGNLLGINNVSTVNLDGGTLRFNTVNGLNRLNYVSGTIQLAGNRHFASNSTITTLYGSTPNIVSGKGLTIEGAGSIGSGANPVESVLVGGGRLKVNSLQIGGDGSGVLNVTNGGTLDLGAGGLLAYANTSSHTGSVLVSGLGSAINSEGGIGIGFITSGLGSMTISNGGTVNSSSHSFVSSPTTPSFVTVTGPGSAWNLPNTSLTVGGSLGFVGTLNIQNGATVFVGTELSIYASSSKVNLDGGTLRFDTIAGNQGPNGINYTSGVIQLAGDRNIGTDAAIQTLFGSSPVIPTGKGLTVEGAATLSSNLALNGGAFTAPAIDGPATLNFASGMLSITGPAGLAIGSGSPLGNTVTLGAGATLNVTNSLHVAAAGRLTNRAGNVQPGSVQIDAGGRWTITDGVQSVGTGLANQGTLVLIDSTLNGPVTSPTGSTVNVVGDVAFAQPFSGAAQFFGSGTATFNGGYNPGDSPANVSFEGNVALADTNTLFIEIGGATPGSQYDRLTVAGSAAIDGILDVSLINGFTPTGGQQFTILTASNLINNGFVLSGSAAGSFNLLVNSTSVILQAISAGVPGDYNGNGVVDAADYVLWRNGGPLQNDATPGVQSGDYDVWRAHFDQTSMGSGSSHTLPTVPEPNAASLGLMTLLAGLRRPRR